MSNTTIIYIVVGFAALFITFISIALVKRSKKKDNEQQAETDFTNDEFELESNDASPHDESKTIETNEEVTELTDTQTGRITEDEIEESIQEEEQSTQEIDKVEVPIQDELNTEPEEVKPLEIKEESKTETFSIEPEQEFQIEEPSLEIGDKIHQEEEANKEIHEDVTIEEIKREPLQQDVESEEESKIGLEDYNAVEEQVNEEPINQEVPEKEDSKQQEDSNILENLQKQEILDEIPDIKATENMVNEKVELSDNQKEGSKETAAHARFLVVDDAKFLRSFLRKIIEEAGHEVIAEAEDGRQAIDFAKELSPDVVTMDITMPEVNGIDALKEILEYNPKIKVIMCSAVDRRDVVLKALQIGAKDFISKPFEPAKVLTVINRVVELD